MPASAGNFGAHDFNRVAAHADVNYAVIFFPGAHKNSAGPLHFQSLFDEHAFLRLGHAVRNHPRRSATRS